MTEPYIIITVNGADKIGIIAEVTALLAKFEVNIEDVKQTLMQGHFVMMMLGNIGKSPFQFKEIKEALGVLGEKLGMEIWVQRKEIFDVMGGKTV